MKQSALFGCSGIFKYVCRRSARNSTSNEKYMNMRKLFIALLLSVTLVFKAAADEGMWLPMLLGQQVYNDMVKKGLKLTKEQLYSVNKASLKDAIVIFGGFCTGEIVSDKGLIFTNHHCGYDVVAHASTVEHNYLKDGFYAKNAGEESMSFISYQGTYR